jgi:hypothetical protein
MTEITTMPTPEELSAALDVWHAKKAVADAAGLEAAAAREHYEALISFRGAQAKLHDAVRDYFATIDATKAQAQAPAPAAPAPSPLDASFSRPAPRRAAPVKKD